MERDEREIKSIWWVSRKRRCVWRRESEREEECLARCKERNERERRGSACEISVD